MRAAKQKFSYWFDNAMSRGLMSLIGLLSLITLVFVSLMTLVVVVLSASPEKGESIGELLWVSLMHALDPGTVVGAEGALYRSVMLITTFGGLVFLAGLIGIISGAFDSKVEELRKGRSKVLESDHTLILGWNSRVFSLISELVVANQSRKKAVIVILSNVDKVEMEDAIRDNVGPTGNTKVVLRTGDPMHLPDLELVSHQQARSIIILAGDNNSDPDLSTIKTALALVNNPKRPEHPYHIVAEIQEPENLPAAKLVSDSEVKWIIATDVMSRIMVQTTRQSGLSQIFLELLDFDGDELYFVPAGEQAGSSYLKAQHAFSNSTLIGIWRDERVMLNPAPNSKIKASDQLILLAPDDSEIRSGSPATWDPKAIATKRLSAAKPEQTLVLGSSPNLGLILSELNQYVSPGSKVKIVSSNPERLSLKLSNLEVSYKAGDPTSRAALNALNLSSFDHIMVLADRSLGDQDADSRTLITLLQLRDIARSQGKSFNVVSEMLDDRNRALAERTESDDFIVSDQLIGLMMSQISENPAIAEVFRYLFSAEGSEITLDRADKYVVSGMELNMHTLIEAAAKHGKTALGYRIRQFESDPEQGFGIRLNPTKSETFALQADDKVIVLSQD